MTRTILLMLKAPRPLTPDEVEEVVSRDVPARLATLDTDGFPHITPLWFLWRDDAFYITSIADRPHVRRLMADQRAGLCVDVEERERADGQRPNRQVRATGTAELFPDDGAVWTVRVTEKYVRGPGAADRIRARTSDERVVIRLRPTRLVAVASA